MILPLTRNQVSVLLRIAASGVIKHYAKGWGFAPEPPFIHPRVIDSLETRGLIELFEYRPKHLRARITGRGLGELARHAPAAAREPAEGAA